MREGTVVHKGNFTNEHGLPPSLVRAMETDRWDHPDRISVTQLLWSPLMRQLHKRHAAEIVEDISDRLWILLGHSIHSAIEKSQEKAGEDLKVYTELKLELQYPELNKTLSGKLDVLDEDRTLGDWKVTSVWGFMFNHGKPKPEEVFQLNAYAFMLRELIALGVYPEDMMPKRLQIVRIFRDWSRADSLRDPEYPRIPFAQIDVPMMGHGDIGREIQELMQAHIAAESRPIDELALCSKEQRWTREPSTAVMKKNPDGSTQQRAKKVFKFGDAKQQLQDAYAFIGDSKDSKVLFTEVRPGEEVRCKNYCSVAMFCPLGKKVLSEAK